MTYTDDITQVTTFKTSDGLMFESLQEAQYHEDKIAIDSRLKTDSDFQKRMQKAQDAIIFSVYGQITFSKYDDQQDINPKLPINIYQIENIVDEEVADYSELTAYGDKLKELLHSAGIELNAAKGPQDETARRGIFVTPINPKNSFDILDLESHILNIISHSN